MATTDYGVNHALAVKIWTKRLLREALKETHCGRFMGTSTNSLIQVKSELRKQAGDRIRVGLRMQLSGDGVQGDDTLEGNEEALTTYSDDIFVDQLRHAVRSGGRMSDQRVPFSVREEALDGLRDWWADRLDESFFNQIAGNTGQTDTKRTGNQTALAPSSGLQLFGNADMTTEASLTASTAGSSFQLTMLDDAVAIAKVNSPVIRPVRVGGRSVYVAFLHPYQVLDLRRNTNNGQWMDIQKSAMMGGQITSNPLFTGAVGMYNGVIIHEDARIPRAGSGSKTDLGSAVTYKDVCRGIFLGAQSGCVAFGRSYGMTGSNVKYKWTEVLNDYENQLGVSAALVYGCKKTVFDGKDFGTLALSSVSTGEATTIG